LKFSPKHALLIFILTLSSCATKKVSEALKEEAPKEIVVSSELRQKAIQAAREAEEEHDHTSIIGSAVIEKPHEYGQKTYFLYGAEHLNLENYYFDIPVVYNDAVKKWITYFLNRGRGFF
jgi:membrane-bound lytic murein transglycosylase D